MADTTMNDTVTIPVLASSAVFHETLLDPANVATLKQQYGISKPYKHAVVPQLFNAAFLSQARQEICDQINFRDKETDIYKISQSGDLTNLSGLPAEELALLPTVLALRDSLYSLQFRNFLRAVTGCGALSGVTTDMSCADYGEGSYLLNHDDVIGTRRISFILYLVLPEPAWEPQWGGALELYPVLEADSLHPDRPNVPTPKPSVSIPPAFNQFTFFEVQPGHSFHSVEEVVVQGNDVKGGPGARMSISGWFHKPIESEPGYEGAEEFAPKSSLQQLYATTLSASTPYDDEATLPLPLVPSDPEVKLLSALINPAYLKTNTLEILRPQFIEESQLVLADFLRKDVAAELEKLIRAEELRVEKGRRGVIVGGRKVNKIMDHSAGEGDGWEVIGPPHIQRFCSLNQKSSSSRLNILLQQIHALFKTTAFRSLLASLTSLLATAHTTQVRRFRPGLDYTLARGEPEEDGESRLDVGLNLTPTPKLSALNALWESGDVGGWELWLATDEDEGGDEATYGGGAQAEEEDEDGPLLSLEPGWNRLNLVLRDPGVLSFVKYVSARAPGSRWDISGEWEVSAIEEEENDDEEDDE